MAMVRLQFTKHIATYNNLHNPATNSMKNENNLGIFSFCLISILI
jgi:hypothetical protein